MCIENCLVRRRSPGAISEMKWGSKTTRLPTGIRTWDDGVKIIFGCSRGSFVTLAVNLSIVRNLYQACGSFTTRADILSSELTFLCLWLSKKMRKFLKQWNREYIFKQIPRIDCTFTLKLLKYCFQLHLHKV